MDWILNWIYKNWIGLEDENKIALEIVHVENYTTTQFIWRTKKDILKVDKSLVVAGTLVF